MKLAHTRKSSRPGFTLIELLVVIAIIAILVGLISAAVLKFLVRGPQTVTRTEIGQLESAIALFHKEFGLGKEYMPSRLVLCENFGDYFASPGVPKSLIHGESLAFLKRMFPKLWRTAAAQLVVVDWNNNGAVDGEVILEGDQCLVFFLGGIPTAPILPGQPIAFGCSGFSYLGSNPATPGGTSRKGPYFEFKSNKLVQIHGADNSVNRYFSYVDGYGNSSAPTKGVYAYFSSYRSPNGYNRYNALLNAPTSDCALLGALQGAGSPNGIWPYAEFLGNTIPTCRFLNSSSFQIISAGADGLFGPGTDFSSKNPMAWTPSGASNIAPVGADDQANFHGRLLGAND
jgi:general secretion pathway protein G